MTTTKLASERWQLLRSAVLAAAAATATAEATGPREDVVHEASVRSFSSFELLAVTERSTDEIEPERKEGAGCVWYQYSYKDEEDEKNKMMKVLKEVSAMICHLPARPSLEAMMGFNNTGNVCVWPSEEVLAYYCLKNREQFHGKSVCELGGGMTSLAGVLLSLTQYPSRMMLTDGNLVSVKNIQRIVQRNKEAFGNTEVSTKVLLWDDHPSEGDLEFDFVICADCLFFVDLHLSLTVMIHKLLTAGGKALMFNPYRGRSLDKFVEEAQKYFTVRKFDEYDPVVSDRHKRLSVENRRYKPDLHYPILLVLEPIQARET